MHRGFTPMASAISARRCADRLSPVQQLHFLHCPQPGHDLFQARFTISFPIRRQIGALGFYALGQLMVPELRFHGQLADGNQVGYAARAALACDLGAG